MYLKTTLIVTAIFAATSIALAHAPKLARTVALKLMQAASTSKWCLKEQLCRSSSRDHSDNDVKTDGFKGTAIFVIDGKPQRIPLIPAGENRLSGTSPVDLPTNPKGAVQITTPSGGTMQAKF